MKKAGVFLPLAGIVLAMGCMKMYLVVQQPATPLKTFGKVKMMEGDAKEFLANVKARDDEDRKKYELLAKDGVAIMKNTTQEWLDAKWKGEDPKRTLACRPVLKSYDPGSAAARFLVGAGRGRVVFDVFCYDGKKTVAQVTIDQEIAGAMFGADKYFAFKQAAYRLGRYFQDEMRK